MQQYANNISSKIKQSGHSLYPFMDVENSPIEGKFNIKSLCEHRARQSKTSFQRSNYEDYCKPDFKY